MSPMKKIVAVGHSILEKPDDTLPQHLQNIGDHLKEKFDFGKYSNHIM